MHILTNSIKHLIRILIHKFWVMYYCFQIGLYWRGITHDLSKFSWVEFSKSVKYYNNKVSPVCGEKKDKGYSLIYLHHRGRNPHHYEYWVTNLDNGGTSIRIPEVYVKELICDYLAAGKTYSHFTYEDELKWWEEYIATPRKIHQETINFITTCFRLISEKQSIKIIKHLNYGNYQSYRRL